MSDFFYRPENAWAADFIPFYKDGEFRLFYLLDWRDKDGHGEGTLWYQISTKDFVNFTENGEMLARGTEEEQDLYVFTGCVIEAEGRFHIFYTGHNPHFQKLNKPIQAVMHAVSDDLVTWRKIPEDTFFAPAEGYEPDDWRDPFVFWNEETGEYWMLLAARLINEAPSRRRGCTALCVSRDLKNWEVRDPFWSPGLYYTHECPDLFKMGDWWYQVFSEFSEAHLTRYRMSRSLSGPWLSPANDSFDGRTYYAAKTASDGKNRYLFGWNPTRDTEKDYVGNWQWGGNLVVHELVQLSDGTLVVKLPESIKAAFSEDRAYSFQPGLGKCVIQPDSVKVDAAGSFGYAQAGLLPKTCKIEATLTFEAGTRSCGIVLCASDDFQTGYYIRLEPDRNRLVFDGYPRSGDVPYQIGLERPVSLQPDEPIELTVLVDGTICEVYLGGQAAMSARMYDHPNGRWGVFAQEGSAYFQSTSLSILE